MTIPKYLSSLFTKGLAKGFGEDRILPTPNKRQNPTQKANQTYANENGSHCLDDDASCAHPIYSFA